MTETDLNYESKADASAATTPKYHSSHPALALPPFQPDIDPISHGPSTAQPPTSAPQQRAYKSQRYHSRQVQQYPQQQHVTVIQPHSLNYDYQNMHPVGFIPSHTTPAPPIAHPHQYYGPPYRSMSLPHVMPSFQYVPPYMVPFVPAPVPPPIPSHQEYYQQGQKPSSEPVSSVFKKTCYKCGNLGHYAEECEYGERLCYNCKQPGHETSDCPAPRSTDLKQCYICRKIGHLQSNCPMKQQKAQQPALMLPQPQFINRAMSSTSLNNLSANSTDSRSPMTGSPSNAPSPLYNPGLLFQRTAYLQTANHAFQQRANRSGSAPNAVYHHGTSDESKKKSNQKSRQTHAFAQRQRASVSTSPTTSSTASPKPTSAVTTDEDDFLELN